MIGCDCETCRSPDQRDKRKRPSVYVETDDGQAILIDAGAGTYMTNFDDAEALYLLERAEDRDSQRLYYTDQAYNARAKGDRADECVVAIGELVKNRFGEPE